MFNTSELPAPSFDPRRVRRWDLSPDELIGLLNQLCNPNGITHYTFFKCPQLPDGFTVLSSFSHRDPWRVSFYIHHPSFEPVERGTPIPSWESGGFMVAERVPYPPPRQGSDEPHTTAATPR